MGQRVGAAIVVTIARCADLWPWCYGDLVGTALADAFQLHWDGADKHRSTGVTSITITAVGAGGGGLFTRGTNSMATTGAGGGVGGGKLGGNEQQRSTGQMVW